MVSHVKSYFTSSKEAELEEETPELLQQRLTELQAELFLTPAHQLSGDDPSFMSPEFLTHFLRTEELHVGEAAKRYRKYWEMRVKLFGDDAGKPFSAEREFAALDLGFSRIVQGGRDKEGRQIILTNPAKMDKTIAGPVDLCRSLWYVIHAALEDPETARTCSVLFVDVAHGAFSKLFSSGIARALFDTVAVTRAERQSLLNLCRTVNLRRPERARNGGSTEARRLDDTR